MKLTSDDENVPPRRSRRLWIWAAALAFAAALVAGPFVVRARLEPLTAELLAAARARWRDAGPASYDMLVTVSGAQTGRYEVFVRGGRLDRLVRDGRTADPAAGDYWTVEGLFRTLEEEMDIKDEDDSPQMTVLLARFHSRLGHPLHFARHVAGTQRSVHIEVQRLEETVSRE